MTADSSDGIDYNKLADKIIDRAVATGMTRREVVSAVAGAGAAGTAIGLMSNRASAQDNLVIDGIDQIGRDSDRVQTLYVENIDNYTSSETFDSVTVNNSLDAGSISTEQTRVDLLDFPESGKGVTESAEQITVSTSAVDISSCTNTAVVFVAGINNSTTSTRFLDRVVANSFGSISDSPLLEQNTPANRSYTVNSENIALAMGSGEYTVVSRRFVFDTT